MNCICPHCKQECDLLKQTLSSHADLQVNAQTVMREVTKHFGIDMLGLMETTRRKNIVQARKFAFYFLRKYAGYGPVQTGSLFGKDHSTVIHSLDALESEIVVDRYLREQLAICDANIRGAMKQKPTVAAPSSPAPGP